MQSFEGVDAKTPGSGATLDNDPNGAVGTEQYLEWVNPVYQVYDKTTFVPLYTAPVHGDVPWRKNNLPNCYGNAGDGVALFDHLASRWVIGRRQSTDGYFYCIAVSSTDDFTAGGFAWYAYELSLNSLLGKNAAGHFYFPDYPKIASWPDAYYVAIDLEDPDQGYREVGVLVCAFDRNNMLNGNVAQTPQCFRYPNPVTGAVFLAHSLLPADIDGVNPPPVGSSEYFISIQNPKFNATGTLNLWQFHVDWTTPSNSTFTGPVSINSGAYIPGCYRSANPSNTICVPEPTTSATHNFIDSVGDRVMHRFAYRHFLGTAPYESYLVTQTVQVNSTPALSQTGIRWHELQFVGGALKIVHSGLLSQSDSNYRFMPSVAQDKAANMAVGYSVSGTTLHPSIRAAYVSLPALSAAQEFDISDGAADEENSYHWGDYTSLTVDPVDDCTFWFVDEYYTINQTATVTPVWQTRIANFKIPNCK